MATKKYVSLSKLSTFLDKLKEKFALISHGHTISDITDYTVDSQLSSTSTNPIQNKVIDAEFETVGTAMNALETAIDGKADASHSHDDLYYTETEMDVLLSSKASISHNHDDAYDTLGSANTALDTAKSYTDTAVSSLASTSEVYNSISTHNTSTDAHNDIRDLITGLTTRLNTLADSDDTTLDQMSEIVEYIKSNKSLIDSITTSKVNVSDVINNLTTNVSNKPLSAAQGVVLKSLIDSLQTVVDGKANSEHTHAISDVIDLQTTLDEKVPTTRTINGKVLNTNITLSASDVGADTSGSASSALASAQTYTDNAVAQKTQVQIITWEDTD